jgi:hypothetical protein
MSQHGIGARVNHVSYGDGTVKDVNEYHTAIDFDTVGLKRFSTPKVVLQSSNTPEPIKAAPKRGRAKAAAKPKPVVPVVDVSSSTPEPEPS